MVHVCSGEAVLNGFGLVPLAVKRIPITAANEEGVKEEIEALKAVSGAEHMIQLVDYKFTEDKSTCYLITRSACGSSPSGAASTTLRCAVLCCAALMCIRYLFEC